VLTLSGELLVNVLSQWLPSPDGIVMTTWFESGSAPALVPESVFGASVLDLSSALLSTTSLSSAEHDRERLVKG